MTLFSPNLKRTELLRRSKSLDKARARLQIHIHRNHAFEPIASVIAPFLHVAGFMGEFVYGDYDDSLSFESLRLESSGQKAQNMEVQNIESYEAESGLDSKDFEKGDLESKKLESTTDLESKKSKGEDCEISKDFQASEISKAQKSVHILFIDTARYTLQGEKLEEFILERAHSLREISPSPILVLLLGEAKEYSELAGGGVYLHRDKNQSREAQSESRPLRGAEALKQGGSSAATTLELEADKRGTPLDCRKQEQAAVSLVKSGGFSGLRGERYICEREGINPFLRKRNEEIESEKVKALDSKAIDSESKIQIEFTKAVGFEKIDSESETLKSKDISAFTKPQYDNDLDSKQTAIIHKAAQKNIFIFDISQLLSEYAHKAGLPAPIPLLDESKEIITGTRLSNAACLTLAQILGLKLLPALTLPSLKAIVCDLDNTLYAGILGEDGAEKLMLTPAHKALQEQILAYKKQGFLLAIASKNDLCDVEALFQKRLDFPLRLSDFSCVQAHWEGKAQSLEAIAKGFNIGLDSLLFIDDNIAELESTRHTNVRQLHALSPTHTLFALYLYPQMTRLVQNKEDSLRSHDIAANVARASLDGLSDEAYFTNLGIELEFCINPKQSAQRIYELLNKTNQFIANYARPTLTEVQAWLEDRGHCVVAISMRDRLSESGIIGIVVGSVNSSLGNHLHNPSAPLHCGARQSAPHSQGEAIAQSNTANTRIVCGEIRDSKINSESTTSDSKPHSESVSPVIASVAKQSIKTDSEKVDCHADKSARNDDKTKSAPLQNLKSPTDSTTPTRHSKICDEKLPQRDSASEAHLGVRRNEAEARCGDLSRKAECQKSAEKPTLPLHSKICELKSGFLRGEQGNRTQGSLTKQDAQIHDFSRKAECLEQARIIELVVSCRALGRRLESLMLLQSFAITAKELGAREDSIILAYQKGERNTPFLRTLATLIATQSAQNPQSTEQNAGKTGTQSPQDLSEQALHALKERGELAIPLTLPPTQGLSIHITKEQK